VGRLSRLLNPQSIAVVGGGAWCESIIQAATKIGFAGTITPIHPAGKVIAGIQSIQSLTLLETPPDATFIGVNRNATIDIVQQLRESGAGGAICFASGFAEAQAELADGDDLQSRLLAAARHANLGT
jgi:acyl-CoA synthetase (NDP forming)